MTDRFDLEQSIMKCWNITDEIQLLNENVLESDALSKDDISNYLLGLETMYNLKFDKLFRQFEEMIKDKKIL
jgi:hypothetical protein